jgi:two-component system, NtrC family, response regulator AtoC
VFPVRVPPLCERSGDIVPLAEHLLGRIARQLGRDRLALDRGAQERLLAYDWPGNVRELYNVLERASILAERPTLSAEDLFGLDALAVATDMRGGEALDKSLDELEKEDIRRALAATGGHRKQAAARLGIGLRTLYLKLKQYGLGS